MLIRFLLVAGLVLTTGVVVADKESKEAKKPKNTNEVMVQLRDRSTINMECLQDAIEIDTKFGKLRIPVDSIRRIDFGLHVDDELRKKIASTIAKLADTEHKVREQAAKDLVGFGPLAYPEVVKATKSSDLEAAKLARMAADKMREKFPENELKIKTDDTIVTDQFPIVGRIATEKIKTKTSIFGDKEIKIGDIVSIRWMGRMASVDVTLEATKILKRGGSWIETGIMVEPEDEIEIKADGSVNVNCQAGAQYEVGPEGADPINLVNPMIPGQNVGAVIGRIGDGNDWFMIGAKFTGPAKKGGKLYLSLGQSPWANGGTRVSGSFKVTINGGREAN